MSRPRLSQILALVAVPLLGVAACSTVESSAEYRELQEVPPGTALPHLTLQCECALDDAEPPSAEDVAAMADLVGAGYVASLTPADGPWTTVLAGQVVDSCEAPVSWGVDIRLTDFVGVGASAPDEVVLRVTARETATWSVRPTVVDSGVAWFDEAAAEGVGVGMRVGAFLALAPSGSEYLGIGRLFWVDDDGVVRFQSAPNCDCPESHPAAVDGSRLDDLIARIRSSGDVAAATDGVSAWAASEYAHSSLCGDPPPNPIPCVVMEPGELECGDGLECDEETMTCY